MRQAVMRSLRSGSARLQGASGLRTRATVAAFVSAGSRRSTSTTSGQRNLCSYETWCTRAMPLGSLLHMKTVNSLTSSNNDGLAFLLEAEGEEDDGNSRSSTL
mmetsp:Transcript_10081/g.30808  ORF Transcript_10081/g.30808 Transcript_10081/m.30808 type:complete len:103 (-) Transcript_10081:289-597(-)